MRLQKIRANAGMIKLGRRADGYRGDEKGTVRKHRSCSKGMVL
jgi:hypothetical protein